MRCVMPAAVVLLALGLPTCVAAKDWPGFRGGPSGTAASDDTGLPTTWSDTENIAWKVPLPGNGSSSPIVSGDRIFLTCYTGYGQERGNPGDQQKLARSLVCLNRADGKILWEKSVPAVLPEDAYGGRMTDHGYASHTPATDGKKVFVFFGKSGVLAFDFDGKQLWQTSVGTGSGRMGWGSGTSVLLHKNLVIVNANAESQAIVALDQETGNQVWKAASSGYGGSWSTPVLLDVGGKQELIVNMPDEVWSLDPNDGGLWWYCSGLKSSPNTSVAARDGVVYTLGGGPGGSGAGAIRAGGRNDVTSSHVVWKKNVGSYVPSPVMSGEYLCWIDDKGVACCLKAETGEQKYRERLGGAGSTYASMIAADGKLYAVSRRNGTFVLAAGPEFKQLAHNKLASDTSDFNASPAVSNGCLLLRSDKFLYCISGSKPKTE